MKDSKPGTKFDEVLELYIVYISEFDFLKGNKTIYHVEKVLRETEGGVSTVCEVMQKYEKIAVDEAMHVERMAKIKKMIQKGYPKEDILDLDYTEEEYAEAEQELLQSV